MTMRATDNPKPMIAFTQVEVASYLRHRIAFHKLVAKNGDMCAQRVVNQLTEMYVHLFKVDPDTSAEEAILG